MNSKLLLVHFSTIFLILCSISNIIIDIYGIDVPVIDVSDLFQGSPSDRLEVSRQIGQACRDVGFFVIIGHNISANIINNTWEVTKSFFDLPVSEKTPYEFEQNSYPYGYTSLLGEVLSSGKAIESNSSKVEVLPDLKEMYSIGPVGNKVYNYPDRRYPNNPSEFGYLWDSYYNSMSLLASKLISAFAVELGLAEDFFEAFTDHHGSALRALNYPELQGNCETNVTTKQYRASAHTDYGMITILRSDGAGLQVSKDKDPPSWVDVPVIEDSLIVNLGDLMKRWTNDKWLSTLHRVILPTDKSSPVDENCSNSVIPRRQSIAFFYNVNSDSLITNLIESEQALYEPIIAGDFLMSKHLAAIGATTIKNSNTKVDL